MKTKHIAHIIIEAQTPLKVGSNASDALQDSPIQKDWNGLPMILGTSIAGVLRKDFDKLKVDDIFGDENGSKVIISNALLLDENKKVKEGLLLEKSDFLKLFDNLPIREHTAITDKGVAKPSAKFDEEVVYKGSRFKFSIELIEENNKIFGNILNLLSSSSFRLGGGSSKGFGKFKVLEITTDKYSLDNYDSYSSSLNHKFGKSLKDVKEIESKNFTKYTLNIKPDDFFIFCSGFGDDEADATPVYEQVIDYDNAKLSDKQILIPASSIKGAISHRTTYHYNLENELFIGNTEAKNVIKEIFGEAKNSKDDKGSKGKVIFSDCFKEDKKQTKVFDHVSIDRFTGGAIDSALFQEKTIADDGECYEIEIFVETQKIEDKYIKAFKSALIDICKGMLPLGGATTKGHGIFYGCLKEDETMIFQGICDEK